MQIESRCTLLYVLFESISPLSRVCVGIDWKCMHAGIRVMSSYDYDISVLRKHKLRVDARRLAALILSLGPHETSCVDPAHRSTEAAAQGPTELNRAVQS